MLDGDYSQHGDVSCTKISLREFQENVHGSALSHDAQFIAFTFANGCMKVYDTKDMKQQHRVLMGVPFDGHPSLGVAWSPIPIDESYSVANVNSQGGLFTWQWGGPGTASDVVEKQYRAVEEKNESTVCEFSIDGRYIYTAGSDRNVRVYDVENLKADPILLNKGLDEDGSIRPAHANRIFSLKFLSPTTFITAGWQSPVQVWDLRTAKAVRQVQGPACSSNCLEAIPGTTRFIACSAGRNNNQIQVFDYVQCREIVEESERFSVASGNSCVTGISYRPETESLWAACAKPDQILEICTVSGEVRTTIPSAVQLTSITSSPEDPERVYVTGAKETCYVIEQL